MAVTYTNGMINIGGLVSVSTVDWVGCASCVIFFRGCQGRCWYCHNKEICSGEDYRDIISIEAFIRSCSFMVSGVVFSGGECTQQPDPLIQLCKTSKSIGLNTCVHTNGMKPSVIDTLIRKRLVDQISLDVKTSPDQYHKIIGIPYADEIINESLQLCINAHKRGLVTLECHTTVDDASVLDPIREMIPCDVKWVLQQIRHGNYQFPLDELKQLGEKYQICIRSEETGEVSFNNHQ